MHDTDKEMTSSLKREKNNLLAQLIQLRRVSQTHEIKSNGRTSKEEKEHEDEDEDEEYEVESLLQHKMDKKKVRSFLVRLKNYSSNHDCWVKGADLNCPQILNEYLRKNNMK